MNDTRNSVVYKCCCNFYLQTTVVMETEQTLRGSNSCTEKNSIPEILKLLYLQINRYPNEHCRFFDRSEAAIPPLLHHFKILTSIQSINCRLINSPSSSMQLLYHACIEKSLRLNLNRKLGHILP
ncbi:hypothetical protein T01_5043 [Trichinella spiralis]|uniref:Uncharacterized protein n=1 Tax=Trichinella spiralis TaxID=6334 RepID=A0A0V1BI03_TRISP|nr:hypothetical protein T01_5043 [Trichinella spiralis]